MRSDSVQSDLLLSANPSILSSKTESRSHHHHRHHCHRCSDEIIRCPHHVALPDGEWNQSYSNLQLRNSYQVNNTYYHDNIITICNKLRKVVKVTYAFSPKSEEKFVCATCSLSETVIESSYRY